MAVPKFPQHQDYAGKSLEDGIQLIYSLTWSSPQVKAFVPGALREIAFPAYKGLFQNRANHKSGSQKKLCVKSQSIFLLRKLVPHRASHSGSSHRVHGKEGVQVGEEEVTK